MTIEMFIILLFTVLNLSVIVSGICVYKWWVRNKMTDIFRDFYNVVWQFKRVMNSAATTLEIVAKTSPNVAESASRACVDLANNAELVGKSLLSVAEKTDKITTQVDDFVTFASIWGAVIALIAVIPYAVRKIKELVPENVAESLPRQTSLDKLEKIAYVLAYIAGAGKLLMYLKDWFRLDSVLVQLFDMSPGQLFDVLTFAAPEKVEIHHGVGFVPGPILSPTVPVTAATAAAAVWKGPFVAFQSDDLLPYTAAECAAMKPDDAKNALVELTRAFGKLTCRRMTNQAVWESYTAKLNALQDAIGRADVPQAFTLKETKEVFDRCVKSWQESPRHYRLAFVVVLAVLGLLSWYVYDRMQEEDDQDENDEDAESRRHFKRKGGRKTKKSGDKSYEHEEKPDPIVRTVAVDPKTHLPQVVEHPASEPASNYLKPAKGGKYLDTKVSWADLADEEDYSEREKRRETQEKVSKLAGDYSTKAKPPVPSEVANAKMSRSQKRREKIKNKILAEAQAENSVKKEGMMRDSKVTVVTGDVLAIRDGIDNKHTCEGRTFALNGHLITAAHNLETKEMVGYVLANHREYKFNNSQVHKIEFELVGQDIARSKKVAPFEIKSLRCVPTAMKLGDKILVRQQTTICSPGEIVSIKGNRIEHNASTTAGWSGSPVILGSTVIGVHTAWNPSLGVNVAEKLPLNFLAPGGFRSAGSMELKRQ